MRYIFIYYNILYIILLILIFIYIKKVLNNCYNIEEFEGTHEPDDTKETVDSTNNPEDKIDSTNKPVDEIDEIFKPIMRERGSRTIKLLSKLEDNEREKYNVDPKNKTNLDDIKLYQSEYADKEKILDELKKDSVIINF
tara:strand:+ start:1761 stop:2177 length:417 start_codon:yes stop_codon:yes gene_type:complete